MIHFSKRFVNKFFYLLSVIVLLNLCLLWYSIPLNGHYSKELHNTDFKSYQSESKQTDERMLDSFLENVEINIAKQVTLAKDISFGNLSPVTMTTVLRAEDISRNYKSKEIQEKVNESVDIKFLNKSTITASSNNILSSNKKLFIPNKELFSRGLHVDWWYDICCNRTTANSKWHPLFPTIPRHSTITYKLADDGFIGRRFTRRLYGFVYTNTSAIFDFKFSARDGIEIFLADTKMTLNNFSKDFNISMQTKIMYHEMKAEDISKQDKIISAYELFTSHSNRVKLQGKQVYFIEIIQGGNRYGGMKIEWRTNNNPFQVINKENLLMLNSDILQNRKRLSVLHEINKPKIKYPPDEHEINRLNFHNIPPMEMYKLFNNENIICDSITRKQTNLTLYEGRRWVDRILVYPKEYFEYTGNWPQNHLQLNESEANDIADDVIKALQTHVDKSIKLKSIVHIEKSIEPSFHVYRDWKKTLYFVELDIISNNDVKNIHRTSLYVRQNTIDKRICFVKEYNQWSHRVTINILTPVRNQAIWIEYLLRTLENVINNTKEHDIRLIMIDYNSTDINVHNLLKSHSVPFDYVKVAESTFNKVKALNIGLNHVTDDASVVFVMDLQLQIPLNMFERIRKHTIRHFTAYCPTLLKLHCGEHEQYTNLEGSMWRDDGLGMMAMYKSDWTKVGGFNEKMFSNQWGGEDWELTDRIVGSGLYLFHNRLPRFYHIYHNSHGTWDGNHGHEPK